MRFTVALLIFALALAACASAQAANSTYSTGSIKASCAPWDGAAIAMTIGSKPAQPKHAVEPPYLNINIWKDLPLHDGQTIRLGSTSQAGSAIRCARDGSACEVATSTVIRIDRFRRGSGATGHYELRFKNGDNLSGSFDLTWVDVRMICG